MITGVRGAAYRVALEHAKALEVLIQEGLRLYPPIAFYSETSRKVRSFGEEVWRCSLVQAGFPPWTIYRQGHRDDAAQFCPARWLKLPEKTDYPKLRFQPFGYGARFCPGKYFIEAELRAILGELVAICLEVMQEGRIPVPLGKLTSRPDYDFCLRFSLKMEGYRETNWGVREANSTHELALAFCWAVLSLSAILTIVLNSKSIFFPSLLFMKYREMREACQSGSSFP